MHALYSHGTRSLDLGDFLRTLPSQAADDATGRASWQPEAPPLLVAGAECDAIVDAEGTCSEVKRAPLSRARRAARQGPSSAPATPQGVPGGSGRHGTPRERGPGLWAPSRGLRCSSQPPPEPPTPLPLDPPGVQETARFCGVEPLVLRGLPHDVMLATGWKRAADEVIEWYRTL